MCYKSRKGAHFLSGQQELQGKNGDPGHSNYNEPMEQDIASGDLFQVFNNLHEALFVHSSQWELLAMNKRAVQLFGVNQKQAKAKDFGRDFFISKSPMRRLSRLWPKLAGGRTFLFSTVARRPVDERLFQVEVFMTKIAWGDEQAVLTTIRDISRQKESQHILKSKRKQLAAILDAIPIPTFVINGKHRVVLWNNAIENFTGILRQDALGRPVDSSIFYSGPPRPVLADLVLENNVGQICSLYGQKNLASCLSIPESYEARDSLTIGGARKDIYFLAAPYRDPQGRVIGAIETIQDITDRTWMEKALKASESRLREITANIPGVVYQYQVSHQNQSGFTFVSDGMRRMMGLDPNKVVKDQQLFFSCLDEDMQNRFLTSLKICAFSGCQEEFVFPFFNMDTGEKIWVKNRSLSRMRENGDTIWNGVLTDITEEKRLEKLRSDVERIVRHDMKSPLIGIAGLARLLLKENLSQKQRSFALTIYQSGLKLLRMINNTMSLLQIEQGTYSLKADKIDLVEILFSLHEEFLPTVENKKVELNYFLEGRSMTRKDSLNLKGEKILLESLFANLLQNALDASPEGAKVTVSISLQDETCLVDIHNQGAVPESIRDRFFERYVTYGKQYGTGLGTYSAMLIARAHGGNISFTTSREEGTHLLVTLPVDRDQGKGK